MTVLDWQHGNTYTSRSCIVVNRVIYGRQDGHVDIIWILFEVMQVEVNCRKMNIRIISTLFI